MRAVRHLTVFVALAFEIVMGQEGMQTSQSSQFMAVPKQLSDDQKDDQLTYWPPKCLSDVAPVQHDVAKANEIAAAPAAVPAVPGVPNPQSLYIQFMHPTARAYGYGQDLVRPLSSTNLLSLTLPAS